MKDSCEILEEAVCFYNEGNYQQAIETAAPVAGDKEYVFTYNELMAHCYFGLQQYENAIWFYKKTIALDPSKAVIEGRLAACFDLLGQPGKASPIFKRLYKANPGIAAHAYQLGYHLLGRQQYKKALPYLLEAHGLNAGVHTDIYFQIGVCYHNLTKWEEALVFLKLQAGVKDGIADCYHLTGNCYYNLYKHEEAIAAYSQAIWYNENHDDAYWQRFLTKKDLGDYDGAEKDIRQALSLNPNRLTLTDADGSPLRIATINIDRSNGNVNFEVEKG